MTAKKPKWGPQESFDPRRGAVMSKLVRSWRLATRPLRTVHAEDTRRHVDWRPLCRALVAPESASEQCQGAPTQRISTSDTVSIEDDLVAVKIYILPINCQTFRLSSSTRLPFIIGVHPDHRHLRNPRVGVLLDTRDKDASTRALIRKSGDLLPQKLKLPSG
eukprot:CAMPEP_0179118434 /NCGR_PEP_ID=MMETSP0796-20121207/55696_1 /TAXON_ID=73915 /ORGANISM="Pyrodinium bahamense, Strain pbaha01" /LENGTH=161 /DNA_ID=CAMNT_0020816881 /DNA_START=237 /DNA_END=722 /DNA_ORIENTATION=-